MGRRKLLCESVQCGGFNTVLKSVERRDNQWNKCSNCCLITFAGRISGYNLTK